jgi:predicted SAM-dependent methyltransferase
MKINLGSGYKRIDGYFNLDHDPLTKPDILVDLEKYNIPLQDNSVEHIIAHHILEHIGDNFLNLIKEMYRISKPNAEWDIKFPHFRSDLQHMDPTHKRTLTVDQFLLFSKDYNHYHIQNWNSSSGFGLKLNVNLEVLKFKHNPLPHWEVKFRSMTQEEIAEAADSLNNVFFETHLIVKVIK